MSNSNPPNRHKIHKKFTMPDPSPNNNKQKPELDSFALTREPILPKINKPALIPKGSVEPKPSVAPKPIEPMPTTNKSVSGLVPATIIKPLNCDICGQAIPNNAARCRFCGQVFTSQKPATIEKSNPNITSKQIKEEATKEQTDLWKNARPCNLCGMPVKNGKVRCEHCGFFQAEK